MKVPPVIFQWNGEAMVPQPRFHKVCNAHFVVGENYRLEAHEHTSDASRGHYFATIKEVWDSLPEDEDRFPSPEHLRKWALVQAGFRDERTFACTSQAEARRLAAFMRPMDEYAVITVREGVVRVWTAQSQRKSAMGAKEFQASKSAVLDLIADLVGTTPDQLPKESAA